MDIEEYKRNKMRLKKKNVFKVFLAKTMILIVLFLLTIIGINKNDDLKAFINNKLLSNNFSFTSFKNLYSKYFGSIIPFDDFISSEPVFNERLEYTNVSKFKDGISLDVTSNYLIPIQHSGIVVFVGEKEGYGNTVIVESDEVTMWYSNVNSNVKLYDEVLKGEYLGEVNGDKLYLVFQKEGVYVDYKDYL